MIFQDLLNQIKSEGRIREDSSFDNIVIALINELFKEAVESQRPFELRNEVSISIGTSGNNQVPLPTNFFLYHQVFYKDINTGREWQLSDEDKVILPAPRGFYGFPKSFAVASPNIYIKPKTNIISGSVLRLIYYKIPPEIDTSQLVNPNPIPRLEPFIIRAAIRRLRMFHADDLQVAQMFTGDIGSAAQGYANDEPEKKPPQGQ
jgi:hypothetical protein